MTSHYQDRVSQIEIALTLLPSEHQRAIVLLGDSLTEVNPATHLAGRPVINMGISGDQADHPEAGVLRRIPLIPRAKPAYIFFMIGINDLKAGKPADVFLDQHGQVMEELRKAVPAAQIWVQSILPVRGDYAQWLPSVRAVNLILEKRCRDNESQYLDLWPLMADAEGELRPDYTDDNLHLLPPAYAAWNARLEELLRAAI